MQFNTNLFIFTLYSLHIILFLVHHQYAQLNSSLLQAS